MKRLKMFEDFESNHHNIGSILEDIVSLEYILSEEGATVIYYITKKKAEVGELISVCLGTKDDVMSRLESIEYKNISKIKIIFEMNSELYDKTIIDEYLDKLRDHLEIYSVSFETKSPSTTGKIDGSGGYSLITSNSIVVSL